MIKKSIKESCDSFKLLFSVGKEDVFALLGIFDLQVVTDSSQHAGLRNQVNLLLFPSSFVDMHKHRLVKIFDVIPVFLLVVVLVGNLSCCALLIESESLCRVHVIVYVFNSVDSLIVSGHDSSV